MTRRLALRLAFDPQPQRPACAALFPATEPSAWLAELLACDAPLFETRLLPLTPVGAAVPVGALAVFPDGTSDASSASELAYARVGAAYLPVHARLEPDLTDAELADLLREQDPSGEVTWVWTPHAGLLRVAADDVWEVSDLLRMPPGAEVAWDAALPGLAEPRRITSVEPRETPNEQDLAKTWLQDGIEPLADADEPAPDLATIPAAPRGWRWIVAACVLCAALAVLAWLPFATREALSGRGSPTAVDQEVESLREIAPSGSGGLWLGLGVALMVVVGMAFAATLLVVGRMLLAPGETSTDLASSRLRGRNLDWLIAELARDPDRALPYAIPLVGENRGGGAAVASSLHAHDDLDPLAVARGSGLTISATADQAAALRRHYGELANREQSLARHRRAAYIWGFLLGEWSQAAMALRQGGCHRDAARVYLERCQDRRRALECLLEGQHWDEALALLPLSTPLAQWSEVFELGALAQIYGAQQRDADQQAVWRRLAEVLQSERRYRVAARLLADRVADAEGALAALEAGTQCRASAEIERRACLAAWIDLLSAPESEERLLTLIECLSDDDRWPIQALSRLQLLCDLACRPSASSALRQAARQSLWGYAETLIGEERLAPADQTQVATLLKKLAPHDILLRRDLQRGLPRAQASLRGALQETPTRPSNPPSWLWRGFPLDDDVRWCAVAAHRHFAYVGGFAAGEAVVIRLPFMLAPRDQHPSTVRWRVSRAIAEQSRLLLAAHEHGVHVHVAGGSAREQLAVSRDTSWAAPLPFAASRDCCAVARTPEGLWWGLELRDPFALHASSYDAGGRLLASWLVADEHLREFAGDLAEEPPQIWADRHLLAIGCGAAWLHAPHRQASSWRLAPGSVRGLHLHGGVDPRSGRQLLVHCDGGVYVERAGVLQALLDECADLRAAALAHDMLLAWEAGEGRWECRQFCRDGRWNASSFAWERFAPQRRPPRQGERLLLAGNPSRTEFVAVHASSPCRADFLSAAEL